MSFVNLYVQTEYSMLRSLIKLDDLIAYAKRENIKTLAITDFANVHGVYKFIKKCRANNIKPVVGLNFNLDSDLGFYNSLLVYAKDIIGYKNILKLASRAKTKDKIDFKFLANNSEGLIVVLPSYENEIIKLIAEGSNLKAMAVLEKYKSAFNDIYIGIDLQSENTRNIIDKVIEFSKSVKINNVALHKTSFLNKDDYEVYKVLRSIDMGISNYPENETEKNQDFPGVTEVNNLFKNYPELLNNTKILSDKCNLDLNYQGYLFPYYPDAKGRSFEYLSDLCKFGLKRRLTNKNVDKNKYLNRLIYELDIIKNMGYSDYFLIVYDFVKYAKQNKILVGPGRGSAPSSLVSYSLGITDIDPLEYDLLFERFLNPERITMPDIDIDFPDNKRDLVINYVANKYGKDKVALITTFGTFGPRLALRDVARVYKVSDLVINEIFRFVKSSDRSIEVCLKNPEFSRLVNSNEEVKNIINVVSKLEGLPRHTSTHAAGVIIANEDLTNYTALQEGLNNIYQTQFEASDLEDIGLVKMDFLGIKNLTIIDDVVNLIKKTDLNFDLNKIPLDDKYTYKMIASGDTDGVFQLESHGMRNLLRSLKTSTFLDIVNANALYRPGPMEMIPSFVNRKFGKEKIDYIDESIKDIIKPTYGTIVFQEQIMLIVQKFAGYSLGMADILRRAVSKKDREVLELERKRFIENSLKQNHSLEVANRVYDYIVKFANYGFNKSHSVSYSLIAYQMAYLKRHYYRYFMATLMSNSVSSIQNIQNYINDCKKKKVEVELPSINISEKDFVVKDNKIYLSLLSVNNLGENTLLNLLHERNTNGFYNSYKDFVIRTKEILNKRVVENLIHAGALDEFKYPRKQMISTYEDIINATKYGAFLKEKLIETEISDDEYTFFEISKYEKEALGFNFKYSIFKQYEELKKESNVVDLSDLEVGKNKIVLFGLRQYREIKTKKNDDMAFLTIYDDTLEMDMVCFPEQYKEYRNILSTNSIYIAQGDVDIRNDNKQIILKKLKKLR